MVARPNTSKIQLDMKIFRHSFLILQFLVLLCALAVVAASCEEEETESERVTRLLTSGAWKLQTATVDQQDRTSVYQGLQITFDQAAFTATNGKVIWPNSGSWQLTDANAKTFDRNDGLRVTINELDDTKLVLTFVWSRTSLAPGRTASINGNHVFTFGK
jgi:hypothetical protein